jgi:alkylation response protein AidB-like acyl-CoA dehydrogenase
MLPFDLESVEFTSLQQFLTEHAADLDDDTAWPNEQLSHMADAGVLGWVVPQEYGGAEINAEQLTQGYERLSESCLTTTFVLTQRNGACQRIAIAERDELKRELLPGLCTSDVFATVGISHLTTSRQHIGKPAVRVEQQGSHFVFDGIIPWVTGAKHADWIITGGTCDDGRQVLAALPATASGVTVCEPVKMLSMTASQTGAVQLERVEIDAKYLIAGPVEGVMKQGRGGGTGSVATSALALGTAVGALSRLQAEAENRPDLIEIHASLNVEREAISRDMYTVVRGEKTDDTLNVTTEAVRQRANSLVLRSTQALLAATKGAGFVQGHPAERAVREAMFFLVWSCPQPVLTAALREFACLVDG